MGSSSFAFNYFWSSVLLLVYAWGLTTARWRQGWRWWLLLTVAILAGLTHEGAVPAVGISSFVVCFLDKRKRRVRWWLFGAFALGAAIHLFSPSTLYTVFNSVETHPGQFQVGLFFYRLRFDNIAFVMPLAALLIAALSRRISMRRWLNDNAFYLIAIAGILLIAFMTFKLKRGVWFADIFSFIVLLRTCLQAFPSLSRRHLVTGVICALILLPQIAATAYYQRFTSEMYYAILAHPSDSPDGVVFYEPFNNRDVPWPVITRSTDGTNSTCVWLASMYVTHTDSGLVCLPKSFEGLAPEAWPKIAGTAQLSGHHPMYVTRNRLNSPHLTLHFGKPLPCATPLDIWAIEHLGSTSAPAQAVEYSVMYQGDTLWCYHFDEIRRVDQLCEIIRIDQTPTNE